MLKNLEQCTSCLLHGQGHLFYSLCSNVYNLRLGMAMGNSVLVECDMWGQDIA
jgi:hypothetical protein